MDTKSPPGFVSRVSPVHTAVRNCTRDEGGPFEVGNQVLISSHRKLPIQQDEEQAIVVGEADPTAHLALQHSQLLPERGILCFKSALGLEERGNQWLIIWYF